MFAMLWRKIPGMAVMTLWFIASGSPSQAQLLMSDNFNTGNTNYSRVCPVLCKNSYA
jgi:hypothetical protein